MKLLFDPDGGDLSTANGNTKIEMIPFLVMRVAEIFSSLLREGIRPKNREFSYCIQFHPIYKKTVESILSDIEVEGLPKETYFYQCDGNKIFEMRGASGGIAYSLCFYLVTKGE